MLIVPANRPERWAKAFASGADGVILDLADAVAPSARPAARRPLQDGRDAIAAAGNLVLVRVSGRATPDHMLDLEGDCGPSGCSRSGRFQRAAGRVACGKRQGIGRGAGACRRVHQPRLRFDRLRRRYRLRSLASRLGLRKGGACPGLPPWRAFRSDRWSDDRCQNPDLVRSDAEYASDLGFTGKLLVHPAQVGPVAQGFHPSEAGLEWAKRVLTADSSTGATSIVGTMVDAPVLLRARQLLSCAARFGLRASARESCG